MDHHLSFMTGCLLHDEPLRQFCLRHGISRKTGYKWLTRYAEAGAVGPEDVSSVRHTLAQAMDPTMVELEYGCRSVRRAEDWDQLALTALIIQLISNDQNR
jgi:hypothetical protein